MKTHSKFCLLIALALFPLLASEKAFAQNATGTVLQTGTGLSTFTINLATTNTFQLDLNITASFNSVGITYFYMTGANGSGLFSLMARTPNNGAPGGVYPDLTSADSVVFLPANALLDPVNNNDLGGTCNTCPIAPGTYFMSTFTFQISGAITPGTYTIFLDSRAIVADDQFADHTLTTNTVTINIIPEPATAGLAVLGGVMLLAFVWRARRILA